MNSTPEEMSPAEIEAFNKQFKSPFNKPDTYEKQLEMLRKEQQIKSSVNMTGLCKRTVDGNEYFCPCHCFDENGEHSCTANRQVRRRCTKLQAKMKK